MTFLTIASFTLANLLYQKKFKAKGKTNAVYDQEGRLHWSDGNVQDVQIPAPNLLDAVLFIKNQYGLDIKIDQMGKDGYKAEIYRLQGKQRKTQPICGATYEIALDSACVHVLKHFM
jgi:hypothetical protein